MKIHCKEPKCKEEIQYERETIHALLRKRPMISIKKAVYLTCEKGHTHRYEIELEDKNVSNIPDDQ
jgi:hypothetical protein